MTRTVSLYEAKTHLSSLVEEVAEGEEIVIAKNGVPRAKLVPVPVQREPRRPAHAMEITYIADDFDALDERVTELFEGT
jgi:prevent-host-death family protein